MEKITYDTLRSRTRICMLDEMINNVRANSEDKEGEFILIADKKAEKILFSICNKSDLSSYHIDTIEKLENKPRENKPKAEAIYLINPCEASLNFVLKDFYPVPIYKIAHLAFLSALPETLLSKIKASPNMSKFTKTIIDLNISYFMQDSEVFHFDMKPLLNMFLNKKSIEVNVAADKLFSVCSTLVENPYIQFYGKSILCKKLAISLQERLSKNILKDTKFHDPRSTVIIVDRTFDMNSPLMHDYCYEVMLHDLINVSEENNIDPDNFNRNWDIVEKEPKKEGIVSKQPLIFLGDSDPLWEKYRYLHILDLISKVMKDNMEIMKMAQKNQEGGLEKDLNRIIEKMATKPVLGAIIESIKNHQKLALKIAKDATALNKIIDIEQGIISGIEQDEKEVDIKKLAETLGKILVDYPKIAKEDYIRLLLMYLGNYNVPKSDIENLSKFLTEEQKDIITNYISILGCENSSITNPERRESKVNPEDLNIIKDGIKGSHTFHLRFLPKLARIVIEASRKELSLTDFPFISEYPAQYGKKKPQQATSQE